LTASVIFWGMQTRLTSQPAEPITIALNNGVQMPVHAVGVGSAGGSVRAVISANIAAGVMHIDTSQLYGTDALVGEVLALVPREALFITSKVAPCSRMQGRLLVSGAAECRERTAAQIASNLANLRVPRVDLLLIHLPPPEGCAESCVLLQAQWAALEVAYSAGYARAIGVSNMCRECLECLLVTARTVPAINQLNYQAGIGPEGESLRQLCAERGIVVESYGGHRHGALALPAVLSAAAARGVPPSRVAVRWLYQQGIPVVSTSANPAHIADTQAAFTDPQMALSPTEMAEIRDDPEGQRASPCLFATFG